MSGSINQEIKTKFTATGGSKVAKALTSVAKGALDVGRSFEQGFGAIQKHSDSAARSVASLTDATKGSLGALKQFKSGARTAANALTKLAVASDAARGVESALKAVGAGAEGVKRAGSATKKFTEETTGGVVRAGNALTQFGHDAKEVWGAFKTGVGHIQGASKAAHEAIGKFAGAAQQALGFVGRLALGAGGAAVAIQQMAVAGERAKSMSAAFEALGGTSGDLARLRDATDNMVDDSTLQRIHNLSAVFGVTQKELDKLVQISVGSANALGGDLAQTLDGVMEAYTKKSAERADTYGVLMGDMGEIYKRVAQEAGVEVSKLSKAQKDAAWEAEFFAKSQKLVSVSTADGAKAARQASTAWENFKSEVSVAASDVFENTARKLKEMDARARSLARSLMGPVAKSSAVDRTDADRALEREKKVDEALSRIGDYTAESINGLEVWRVAIADAKADLANAQLSWQRLVDEGGTKEQIAAAADQLERVKTRLREASAAQREWNATIEHGGHQYAKLIINGAKAIDEQIKAVEKAEKEEERLAKERARRHKQRIAEIEREAAAIAALAGEIAAMRGGGADAAGQGMVQTFNALSVAIAGANRKLAEFSATSEAFSNGAKAMVEDIGEATQGASALDGALSSHSMGMLSDRQKMLMREQANMVRSEGLGLRGMADAMIGEAEEAQLKASEADALRINAMIGKGGEMTQALLGHAQTFAKTERDRAIISTVMEGAAALSAFASGNPISGALHAASAVKYGIIAGRSSNSPKAAAKQAERQQAQSMSPRGDMNFGWNSTRRGGSGGGTTQTINQIFQFGDGGTGRAIINEMNREASRKTGITLDRNIIGKRGHVRL